MPNDDLDAYLDPVPKPRRQRPTSPHLDELTQFAKENNLTVGSTTGGRHNRGSLHYSGNAVDIKNSGAFDDATVSRLSNLAMERGLKLRDERRRPKGQAVWGGSHIHLEYSGQPQDDLDKYLDPSTVTSPVTKQVIPRVERKPSSATLPSSPFAGLKAGVSGRAERPAQGVGDLRRLDDPEASRIIRQQRQVAAEPNRRANARLLEGSLPDAEEAARRASEERSIEIQQAQHAAEYQRNKPEIDRLAKTYRSAIRGGNLTGVQWGSETTAKGIAPLVEKLAGIGSLAASGGSPGAQYGVDKLRLHAQALQQAAMEEGADRNEASKFVQDVTAGFIGTAPELVLMSAGVPAPVAFAAGSGTQARGRGEPVAPAMTHGALTGAAFEIPVAGKGIGRGLKRAGAVGTTTAGIDLAAGATPREALTSGATNALLVGAPEIIGGRRARQTETQRQGVQAEESAKVIQAESVVADPAARLSEGSSVAKEPQRFQHVDFGEVEVTPSQQGARRGRVRVAEVSNPENIHYIKKTTLQGRGNERAIPLKPETKPDLEQYLDPAEPAATASPEKSVEDVSAATRRPLPSVEPSAPKVIPSREEFIDVNKRNFVKRKGSRNFEGVLVNNGSLLLSIPVDAQRGGKLTRSVESILSDIYDKYAASAEGARKSNAQMEALRKWQSESLKAERAPVPETKPSVSTEITGYDSAIRKQAISGQMEERRLNVSPDKKYIFRENRIPAGTETVTVYRVAPGEIREGDYVALDRKYAEQYLADREGSIQSRAVSVSDLIQGADAHEVIYAPKVKSTAPTVDRGTKGAGQGGTPEKASSPAPSTTQEPEIKTSRLAVGVESKAIEAKLTEGFKDLPEYETVKVRDQAERAAKLLENDPERAARIAMGKEAPPVDLLPESVFIAVENRALKNGDVDTLRALATASTLPTEATGMGQRISMLAARNPNSAVSTMRDIQLAREAKAEKSVGNLKQAKNRIQTEIRVEVKKSAPKARDWANFLESIKC